MSNCKKPFKLWEKKFNRGQISAEQSMRLKRFDELIAEGVEMGSTEPERWPLSVTQWPQSQVQYCVYDAADAAKWQLFRVSMKNTTTVEKLKMLLAYFVDECFPYAQTDKVRWEREKVRIDNYIGALVRGGQLNPKHEINS